MRFNHLAPVAVFATAIMACDRPSPSELPGASASLMTNQSLNGTANISKAPLFAVDVKAVTTVEPNSSGILRVTVTGLASAHDGTVQIFLPDFRNAERGGWKKLVASTEKHFPVVERNIGPVAVGQSLTFDVRVSPKAAGQYRIVVSARAQPLAPDVYSNGNVTELWFTVAKNHRPKLSANLDSL